MHLHKNLIFAAGDLFSAIGDVQRGVLGVQLARVHPTLQHHCEHLKNQIP